MENNTNILIEGNSFINKEKEACFLSILIKNNFIIKVSTSKDTINNYIINNKILLNESITLSEEKLILPGFVESHIHPFAGQLQKTKSCNIQDLKLEKAIEVIKDFLVNNQLEDWYFICGYNDDIFDENVKIHYSILDEISTTKPISVLRFDCHALWVNSAAIKYAKIDQNTQNPIGGKIEKDIDNNLIGVFNDSAMALINSAIPKLDYNKKITVLENALKHLVSKGITTILDACVKDDIITEAYISLYADKIKSTYLPNTSLAFSPQKYIMSYDENDLSLSYIDKQILSIKSFFSKYRRNNQIKDFKLIINCVKLFIDGVYESGTALIHQKYPQTDTNSVCCSSFNDKELQTMMVFLLQNNYDIHCHTVGDKAISITLDAIENAFKELKVKEDHNYNITLAHIQVCQINDIERMCRLNIKANFSPMWFCKDSFTNTLHSIVGDHLLNNIYPIRYLLDKNIICGFGSDWPISSEDPFKGIKMAVTHRKSIHEEIYNPNNLININEAIDLYTIQSAKLLNMDKYVGSIEENKLADLLIINKNILKSNFNEEDLNIKIDYIIVNGNIITN